MRATSIPRSAMWARVFHTFCPVITHSSPSRTARVARPARSEPEPGSLNSWHQASSPVKVRRSRRARSSSEPWVTTVGPAMVSPKNSRAPAGGGPGLGHAAGRRCAGGWAGGRGRRSPRERRSRPGPGRTGGRGTPRRGTDFGSSSSRSWVTRSSTTVVSSAMARTYRPGTTRPRCGRRRADGRRSGLEPLHASTRRRRRS